jgi:chemotaxis protein methyltransferase CheR
LTGNRGQAFVSGDDILGVEPMRADVCADLREFINRESGLSYDDKARQLIERRIAPRLVELKLTSFAEYVRLVKTQPDELDWVYETLTTKETYFFRQEYQFQAFEQELLPLIVQQGGAQSRLTVWSAGCSSGEEAYTLAILLSQSPLLRGWKVSVIGTDLCPSNIDTALRGIYRPTSFRTMDETTKAKYFTPVEGGMKVNATLKRLVHFSVGNLTNSIHVKAVGRLDVIFCRNVLIYFDELSRRTVTSLFYERLLPGGYLLLGHSESLLNAGTHFEPVHLKGDLVYRRPPLERGSQPRIKAPS